MKNEWKINILKKLFIIFISNVATNYLNKTIYSNTNILLMYISLLL
jgi:hypothetical protein